MKKVYVTRDTRGYIVPTVIVPDEGFVLEDWDDFPADCDSVTETIVYRYTSGDPSDPGFRSWPERGFTGEYRGPLKTDSRGEKYREQTWKKVTVE